jgi:predicted ArsR family transcriptional regulator
MNQVAEALDLHPEHRMTTLDRLICHQLEGKPNGLTALSLVERTEASMRYADQRLTELVRAGIVERMHKPNASGRTITLYALSNPSEPFEDSSSAEDSEVVSGRGGRPLTVGLSTSGNVSAKAVQL